MLVRLLLVGLTASAVAGCATAEPDVVETQVSDHDFEQRFPDDWPLTVRGGTLGCRLESGEVFFRPAGQDVPYRIDGPDAAAAPAIDVVTKPGGDLSRLLREGQRLCDTPR